MKRCEFIVDDDFRMKVVNFLKIYGYYGGVLVQNGMDRKYVNGEISLDNVFMSKQDFKELKMSVNKVLDYCYENGFDEMEAVMNYFYKMECRNIRNTYGGFFDKN